MITYTYFKFGTKEASEKYGISKNRINQIYRGLLSHLFEQKLGIPRRKAVYDRELCRSKDRLQMVKDYYLSVFGKSIEESIL
jgi:hypothetical protein